jgi:acyl CoA:acetate/3-ketoacid CoA transferase
MEFEPKTSSDLKEMDIRIFEQKSMKIYNEIKQLLR